MTTYAKAIVNAHHALNDAAAAIAALRSAHITVAEGVAATASAIEDGAYNGSVDDIAEAVFDAYALSQSLVNLADAFRQAHRELEPLGQYAYLRTKAAEREAYAKCPGAELR